MIFPQHYCMPVKTKLLKLWFPTLQGEGKSLTFFSGDKCRRAKGEQCNYCKAESFCFFLRTLLGGEISGNSHLPFQIMKPKNEILKKYSSSKKKLQHAPSLTYLRWKLQGNCGMSWNFPCLQYCLVLLWYEFSTSNRISKIPHLYTIGVASRLLS